MRTGIAKSTLPMSLATWQWLLPEDKVGAGAGTLMRMAWQARWSQLNWFLSRQILKQESVAAIQDPVFIIGPWRSGTTVMHELLAAATGFPTAATWQCMNASSFLLTGERRERSWVPRPMDNLPVYSDSPQEDEFALLALGVPSAYRGFIAPRRLAELIQTLEQAYWLNEVDWLDTWVDFLRACLKFKSDQSLPLLLKSPNHTYRVRAILQRFPRSRFIWMDREPKTTFHSNVKMWSRMFELYGLNASSSLRLETFLATAFHRAAEALLWCVNELPPEQLVVVKAHQLELSSKEVILHCCQRLGLESYFMAEQMNARKSTLPAKAPEEYSTSLSEEAYVSTKSLHSATRLAYISHGLG